jgi:hypothetical protein
MLLLDRTHFEAMRSGLLSPQHLFTELADRVIPPDIRGGCLTIT